MKDGRRPLSPALFIFSFGSFQSEQVKESYVHLSLALNSIIMYLQNIPRNILEVCELFFYTKSSSSFFFLNFHDHYQSFLTYIYIHTIRKSNNNSIHPKNQSIHTKIYWSSFETLKMRNLLVELQNLIKRGVVLVEPKTIKNTNALGEPCKLGYSIMFSQN